MKGYEKLEETRNSDEDKTTQRTSPLITGFIKYESSYPQPIPCGEKVSDGDSNLLWVSLLHLSSHYVDAANRFYLGISAQGDWRRKF